jgi:hypothetical protein
MEPKWTGCVGLRIACQVKLAGSDETSGGPQGGITLSSYLKLLSELLTILFFTESPA